MNKDDAKLTKTPPKAPVFVEADKMFERLAEISKATAARAYDFFIDRGAQIGTHFEDWIRAESEMLRAAPARITEAGNTINVIIAVPGFKAEEIEVSVKDDLLIVSGETATEEKNEEEKIFFNEWRSDRFLRKLVLPGEVEADKVEAKVRDGVLRLTFTKKAETEATKVAVQAA
jgi:HSP20 family protein